MADETARLEELLTAATTQARSGETVSAERLAEIAQAVRETDDPGQRVALGHAYLGLLPPEHGAAVAREWITGDDVYLRDAGFEGLVDCGPAGFDSIAALAASEHRDERWYGVEAARLLRDPIALPVLTDALADDDFGIRWAASQGLVAIGEPALIPVLEKLVRTGATVTFHRSVLWTLRRLPVPEQHRQAQAALIDSLGSATTVYTSGPLAEELLQALRR